MFFNSLSFIFVFLPVVVIGYFLIGKTGMRGQIVLTSASLVFYFFLIPQYLPLLIVSIAFNYLIGWLLLRSLKQHGSVPSHQYLLWIGIIGNLGLLGYYKYFNFAISNVSQFLGFTVPIHQIILPLGISFFTFTQLAFLIDIYRGKVENVNPLSYAQFVTFFPHLIAGPIYHHADIIPQFEDRSKRRVDWGNINLGLFFFFFGLAKKVIIADTLATIGTPIFSAVSHGGTPMFVEAWAGALAYTFQLYFDFSGYCDMAIGLALLFNIRFPVNFFSPYRVTSIIDFWRCWNITLSTFLRDYVYIPLGGNRRGFPSQIRNIMITVILGGLWHGANWTFIVWGGLHGVYLVINHLWRKAGILLHEYLCWIVTFVAVVIGWVFFRADSVESGIRLLKGMSGWYGISVPAWLLPEVTCLVHSGFAPLTNINMSIGGLSIAVAFGIALFLPNLLEMTREYQTALVNENQCKVKLIDPLNLRISYQMSALWCVLVGIIAVCAIVSLQTSTEFLYFQF